MLTEPPYSQLTRHVPRLGLGEDHVHSVMHQHKRTVMRVARQGPRLHVAFAEGNAWVAQVSTALLGEPELKSVSSVFSYGNLLFTAGRRCVDCCMCLCSFHSG